MKKATVLCMLAACIVLALASCSETDTIVRPDTVDRIPETEYATPAETTEGTILLHDGKQDVSLGEHLIPEIETVSDTVRWTVGRIKLLFKQDYDPGADDDTCNCGNEW